MPSTKIEIIGGSIKKTDFEQRRRKVKVQYGDTYETFWFSGLKVVKRDSGFHFEETVIKIKMTGLLDPVPLVIGHVRTPITEKQVKLLPKKEAKEVLFKEYFEEIPKFLYKINTE